MTSVETAVEMLREVVKLIDSFPNTARETVKAALALLAKEPEERCGFESCRMLRRADIHCCERAELPWCGFVLVNGALCGCLKSQHYDGAGHPFTPLRLPAKAVEPQGETVVLHRTPPMKEWIAVAFSPDALLRSDPRTNGSDQREYVKAVITHRLRVTPATPAKAEWEPVR